LGLGDEFLRHIERTKVLVHLVDPLAGPDFMIDPEKVFQSYQVILKELEQYGGTLPAGRQIWDITRKPQVVVINKVDVTEVKENLDRIVGYFNNQGVDVLPVSAVTGEGLEKLRKEVLEILSHSITPEVEVEPVTKKYNLYNLPGLHRRPVLTKEVKGLA